MDIPVKTIEPFMVNAKEVARLLGISRSNFYGLLSAGRIGPAPIHLGRRVLWQRAEIEAWVRADCPAREKWLLLKEPA